jgi:uncharacterized Zn finger protein (UPF0148 family)
MSKTQYTACPFCKSVVEVDINWAIRNGRIFCGSCCKSFDIRVGEETEDEPPKKEVPADIKEKFNKGIEEILDEDKAISDEDDGDFTWF